MKVYDCFTFYNEFELLELRLKTLWNMVDYFVIVEADKTQNNVSKPFYFSEGITYFKEFLPKIRHLPLKINVAYKGKNDWTIENEQRNSIIYGLTDAAPEDLIFISDIDEIPDPDILQRLKENRALLIGQCPLNPPVGGGELITVPCQLLVSAMALLDYTPIALQQHLHIFYIDWLKDTNWRGTVITKRKHLTKANDLRLTGHLTFKYPIVLDAGHHFSWMGGIDRVIKKLSSIVEGDVNVAFDERLQEEKREETLKAMHDGYFIGEKLLKYDISKIKWPYIGEFLRKYPYFLRKYDFGKDDI